MSLTVLSDDQIQCLLEGLTHDEAQGLSHALKCTLHEYSTGQQSIKEGLIHQPERTVINSKGAGATTLFMPSMNAAGHGVKVVTLSSANADPAKPKIQPTGSVTLYSPTGLPVGFLHAKTLTAFRTALASSSLLTKRGTVKHITVYGAGLQAYWHIRLSLMLRGHGIKSVHVINRRFSDNVKWMMKKLYSVPQEVKQREGWTGVEFGVLTRVSADFERLEMHHIRDADVIYCCTPSTQDLLPAEFLTSHEGRKKGRLIAAIGSYTPSMREIPKELLLQATKSGDGHRHFHKHAMEGGVVIVDTLDGALKEAGEIIEAGLQPRQLVELGELVMIRRLVEEEAASQAAASFQNSETSSLADSMRDSLQLSSGGSAMSSVFGSTASPTSPVKGGGLSVPDQRGRDSSPVGGSRSRSRSRLSGVFSHGRSSSTSSSSPTSKTPKQKEKEDHLVRWIRDGNVIYKSVGLGLMDLAVGLEIVRLAKEKNIGSHIPDFSAS